MADPARATWQEAYLRHQFRFLGIRNPDLRQQVRKLLGDKPLEDIGQVYAVAEALFTHTEREYHQAACMLLDINPKLHTANVLPLAQRLITTHSWWDTVDTLAIHTVGRYLLHHPTSRPVLDEWIESPDMWLQRTAVIAQIGWKKHTDVPRLFDYCLRLATTREFFLQKGMGWALRDLAKQQPQLVYDFVDSPPLPALTRREACKHRPKL